MSEKKFNPVGLAGGAIYILSNFLPMIDFGDGTISLIEVEKAGLIFAVISLIFCFKTIHSGIANGAALIGLSLIEFFVNYLHYNSLHNESGGDLCIGMYLLFIGAAVTFAAGIYAFVQRKKNS